jgi:hypothetical protein
MEVANTLAYHDTATMTAVENFIVKAPKAVFLIVCDPSVNEL